MRLANLRPSSVGSALVGCAWLAVLLTAPAALAGTLETNGSAAAQGTFGLEVSLDCQPPDLVIPAGTVSGQRVGCNSVTAGNVQVVDPGAVFTAGNTIRLEDGFSVDPGAPFEARLQPLVSSPVAYVEDGGPIADSTYNARFRLRLNTLMLDPLDEMGLFNGYAPNGSLVFSLIVRRNAAGTQNGLVLAARDEGTGTMREHPTEFNPAGGFNLVQIAWSSGGGNGTFQLSLGGGALAGLVDLDNPTLRLDSVRWGSVDGAPAGGGSLDLDDFTSWRSELREIPARLTAPDAAANDEFGRRVAVDGDTLVIGLPRGSTAAGQTGSVYVFVRVNGVWTFQQKLTASDAEPGDRFGSAVDVSGDFIAVGARSTDNNPSPSLGSSGSAYVFKRAAGVWAEEVQLFPKERIDGRVVGGMKFGSAIGIDTSVPEENPGDGAITTVVVGAPEDQEFFPPANFPRVGAIYLFTRGAGPAWNVLPRFFADDAFPTSSTFARFGDAVAIGGDGILVGSPGWNSGTGQPVLGHAYFYQRRGITSTWNAEFLFEASDASDGDSFGDSVSVTPDGKGEYYAVVGAPAVDDGVVGVDTGAAYVYHGNTNLWDEAILVSNAPQTGARFGDAVGVHGSLLAVGEPERTAPPAVQNAGAVHVFRLGLMDSWDHLGRMEAPTPASSAFLGVRLGISGETVAAGAPTEDEGALSDAGVTYTFALRTDIFADGFESGNVSAWSSSVP